MNQIHKQQKKVNALREKLREVESKIKTAEYSKLHFKNTSKHETLTEVEQILYDAMLSEKKPLLNKSRRLKRHINDQQEKLSLLKRPKPLF